LQELAAYGGGIEVRRIDGAYRYAGPCYAGQARDAFQQLGVVRVDCLPPKLR
jgi:hypothetical protein